MEYKMKPMGAALAERKSEKPKKKKVDTDMLKSAMQIRNVGDGVRHAASIIASKIKKDK